MTTRLFSALLSAMALLSLAACNNSGETTSNNNEDTSKSTPSNNTAPASSIVTTPQHMLVVKHKVSNFAKWKMAYDAQDSARMAAGIHSFMIGRGLQDSNMVLVAMRADDSAKAMAF